MPQSFRFDPQMPVGAYKTYTLSAPIPTHWRPASCKEVDCANYLNGWRTILPADSDQADLVRSLRGRYYHFTETPQPGGLIEFTFPAGQPCFEASTHRVPLERDPIYLVRGGDWRGNPTGERRIHQRVEDWVDDFATHQDRLHTAIEKG